MPGIAGVISNRPADECERWVAQMLDSMRHETFYVSRTVSAPELGVYAGQIALEDSFSDFPRKVPGYADIPLVLSGECFGDVRSGRDLIVQYDKHGDRFVEELNGVFSGFLIDRRGRRSLLFNDRYGMERIYYHEGRDGLFFSSEAKALLRVLPQLRAFDPDGLGQFLQFGCTLEANALFRDVKILTNASLWIFDGRGCVKRRYFDPATWESQLPLGPAIFIKQFGEVFKSVLPRYFTPGSDVGVSLTGGLDTRMIMSCRPVGSSLVSYTFAGLTGDTVDVRLAAQVARACGVPHHVLRIHNDFFSDFASLADRTIYVTDGCLDVCGAHRDLPEQPSSMLSSGKADGQLR